MSRSIPASQAWAAYFSNHPEVAANWGEANGRQCNCQCAACMISRQSMNSEDWAPFEEPGILAADRQGSVAEQPEGAGHASQS